MWEAETRALSGLHPPSPRLPRPQASEAPGFPGLRGPAPAPPPPHPHPARPRKALAKWTGWWDICRTGGPAEIKPSCGSASPDLVSNSVFFRTAQGGPGASVVPGPVLPHCRLERHLPVFLSLPLQLVSWFFKTPLLVRLGLTPRITPFISATSQAV